MKFEHLVEVNNPGFGFIPPLSIEQLWQGLILRAKSPKLFIAQLDECHVLETSGNSVSRILHYGDLVVRDTVTFTPLQHVRYAVPQQGELSASSLRMTIEAPEVDTLFVRFVYEDEQLKVDQIADGMSEEFRKSAYHEADIDTIRIIRELALEGRFDAPLS